MDVKVIQKPSSTLNPVVPNLVFKSSRGYPLLLQKSTVAQCYATKLIIKERPFQPRNTDWTAKTATLPNLKFSKVQPIEARPVPLRSCGSHRDNHKEPSTFCSFPMQTVKQIYEQDTNAKTVHLPMASQANNNLSNKLSEKSSALVAPFKNQIVAKKNTYKNLEPVPEIIIHPVKKSEKRRSKSSKKRRKKRLSSKSSCRSKKSKDVSTAPVKKNITSCFPLYSAHMTRSDQPKLDITDTATNMYSSISNPILPKHSRSAHEPRRSNLSNRRDVKCFSLPPATTYANTLSQPKPLLTYEKEGGDVQPGILPASLFPKSILPKETGSCYPKRNTSIKLPPAPATRLSEISGEKPAEQEDTQEKFTRNQRQAFSGKNLKKQSYDSNTLSGRLNLIHHYGNDYVAVTQRVAEQRRRAFAQKQYQTREHEREANERQKMEQRKKIYALNRLMTSLEREKFNEFFDSLNRSE